MHCVDQEGFDQWFVYYTVIAKYINNARQPSIIPGTFPGTLERNCYVGARSACILGLDCTPSLLQHPLPAQRAQHQLEACREAIILVHQLGTPVKSHQVMHWVEAVLQ